MGTADGETAEDAEEGLALGGGVVGTTAEDMVARIDDEVKDSTKDIEGVESETRQRGVR